MDWRFDTSHTAVEAQAKHMMFTTVRVRFPGASGEVRFDPVQPEAASVQLEIPVAALASGDERRDAHLRSADFFDAEAHPTISFRSTTVRQLGEGRFAVTGDLAIRGTSRPVTIDVELHGPFEDPMAKERSRVHLEARARIDRREWGLVWNMPVPQGVLVSNEIDIEVAAELVSAVPATQAA